MTGGWGGIRSATSPGRPVRAEIRGKEGWRGPVWPETEAVDRSPGPPRTSASRRACGFGGGLTGGGLFFLRKELLLALE